MHACGKCNLTAHEKCMLQEQAINATTFTQCCMEWRYMQLDTRLRLLGLKNMACAACQPHPHSVHIDANMKLYVWDRRRQPWRQSYLAGLLFQRSTAMKEHMDTVDQLMGRAKVGCALRGLHVFVVSCGQCSPALLQPCTLQHAQHAVNSVRF